MNAATRLRTLVSTAALSCFLLSQPAFAQSTTDVLLEWNRILNTALATPGAVPPTVFVTRPASITSIAVFDALNSIDPLYTPFVSGVNVPAGASREAAIAQAAHDAMVAMMPSQAATFGAALASTLSRIDPAAAAAGSAVGAAAARNILAARANDGWDRPNIPFALPALPGYWQPTPTANAPAGFVHYPNVQGFIYASSRGRSGAPPALTSAAYAADFNEVKSIGAVNSTTRTAAETALANTWAAVGNTTNPISAWNAGMQHLTRSRNMTAVDAARMFALVNMAMHDGLWLAFSGKFEHGLWRPVTAIREAARDNNPATEPEPNWLPLVQTPPYPAYPGNNACIGAASSATLAGIFGRDDIPFSITWTVPPPGTDIVRSYNGFRQAADEEARSRIFAGIHYTFDNTVSFGICTPLGEYAVANYLRRR